MKQDLCIWSPVILASLSSPRLFEQQISYEMDGRYKRLKEIRLRVRKKKLSSLGRSIEVLFVIDLLCVVEDSAGKSQVISREEQLKDRVLMVEFDRHFNMEAGLINIIDVLGLYWDGDLSSKTLRINCYLSYNLMIAREKIIKISDPENERSNVEDDYIEQIKQDAVRLGHENEQLCRQAVFYEKDIISLKRGIQKAERRCAILNREKSQYQTAVEQLKEDLNSKEILISSYRKQIKQLSRDNESEGPEVQNKLGRRIKQLLMNTVFFN